MEKPPASSSAPSAATPVSKSRRPRRNPTAPGGAGCSASPAAEKGRPRPADCETSGCRRKSPPFRKNRSIRDLYLWLAALAASDDRPPPWFVRNSSPPQGALRRFPPQSRATGAWWQPTSPNAPDPAALQPDEAAQELAPRQALTEPGSGAGLPPSVRANPDRPSPSCFMAGESPNCRRPRSAGGEGRAAGRQRQRRSGKEACKAERVDKPENKNALVAIFRAESLPTWAEYVRVNRAYDDDADPNARTPPRISTGFP